MKRSLLVILLAATACVGGNYDYRVTCRTANGDVYFDEVLRYDYGHNGGWKTSDGLLVAVPDECLWVQIPRNERK